MIKLIDSEQTRSKSLTTLCIVILALIAAFAVIVSTEHAHTWVEHNIPFFWSFFGFAAAAAIIGIANWLGKSGIRVSEDYYDKSIWLDEDE